MVTMPPRVPATAASNSRTSRSSPFFLYSVITGTKAWLKAPSANSRRKKLGMRLAKKKTSAATPAPSRLAMTTSRTKPITRDASVIPDTIMPDLINFLLKTRPLELSEWKECC